MLKKTILAVFLFLTFTTVQASTFKGIITADGVALRKEPNSKLSNKIATLNKNQELLLFSSKLEKDVYGCEEGWLVAIYNDQSGYVCSRYVKVVEIGSTPVAEFDNFESKIKATFPESYWDKLFLLHLMHPTWEFEPIITKLDWNDAVKNEAVGDVSLINTKYDGYKSTADDSYNWATDTFKVLEGSSWYAAHPSVVAYYMDPRNFLNEQQIFMFEKLNFDEVYQTKNSVLSVWTENSYLKSYVDVFYEAGQTYNISPIYLAARVRQETGNNGGTATSGAPFTYNGKEYKGLYNLYNIGATTGANPVYKGLIWANGGTDGSSKTYFRPWTSIELSIKGGAWFISEKYIACGQYTSYLQRFNVDPSVSNKYRHQYMTNIQGASVEANLTYDSYAKMDSLNIPFKFSIPIYENMPLENKVPNSGNPNNHLSTITINGVDVLGFAHDTYEYTTYVATGTEEVTIEAKTINTKAKVESIGKNFLTGEKTLITLKVIAENGNEQLYKINVVKSSTIKLSVEEIIKKMGLKNNDNIITGLVNVQKTDFVNEILKYDATAQVTINSSLDKMTTGTEITIKNEISSKTYYVVIYGDLSGDGDINILDLLKLQKHILEVAKLDKTPLLAADVNKDGKVDIADLLRCQKHILGLAKIEE